MYESKAKLISYVPKAKILILELGKEFEPSEGYVKVNLCKWREHRSGDANAKFWVLCHKLSAVIQRPPVDIYRDYIRDVADNCEIFPIKNEAVKKWVNNWEGRGLGWICDILGPSKHDGYTNVVSYYGSSTYTTAQMSRLLNLLVEDCKEQGIETLSPDELEQLLSRWEDR